MFIVSMETTGYKILLKIVIDHQSLALYAIYKHSPSGLPSGVMLILYYIAYKPRESSITITYR